MSSKRARSSDSPQDAAANDVLELLRAVADAFNQVLGSRVSDAAPQPQLSVAGNGQNYPMVEQPSHEPLLGQSLSQPPLRPTWSRCMQCQRCHDPAKRCRCYACGNLHHSGLCAMSSGNQVRCPVCSCIHAPGPCTAAAGPLPTHCEQCGRHHMAGIRCKCRTCGAMHVASVECNNVRGHDSQDVYVGAAFSRQPVAMFDCGALSDACPHCGALFFDGEAQYLNCCHNGTIAVRQKNVWLPHLAVTIPLL